MHYAGVFPQELLERYASGDWGDARKENRQENLFSVKRGFRILSSTKPDTGAKVWIITEADRSATTFLLPEEYEQVSPLARSGACAGLEADRQSSALSSAVVRATTAKTVGMLRPHKAERQLSEPSPYGQYVKKLLSQRAQSSASNTQATRAVGPENNRRNVITVMSVRLAPGKMLRKWGGPSLL
jgi:hypothetical protein